MKIIFLLLVLFASRSFAERPPAVRAICQDSYAQCLYRCRLISGQSCQVLQGNCAPPVLINWSILRDGLQMIGVFDGRPDMNCRL